MAPKMTGRAMALAALLTPLSVNYAAAERDDRPASRTPSMSVNVSTSNAAEQRLSAYITGYGYWDNTPPGSAAISKPVIHRSAGGTGTYKDPVTIAVGHRIEGGRQTLDYAPGTRFYIKRLRKYAIVEDVCGDGNRPQDGPCHTGYRGNPWLDIYIGGAKISAAATDACARQITALQTIIINPGPDYPVHVGEVASTGCKVF